MSLHLPHTIEELTVADATEVQGNYSFMEEYINTQVLLLDGSQEMQGPLTLKGSPTQPQHAVPKTYIDALVPIGTILPYGGMNAPTGGLWLACNGTNVAVTDYPDLHSVLLTRYGTAPAGFFKLPNLQGRVMIGMNAADDMFKQSGLLGGTWTVPVPQHNHDMTHDHGEFDSGVNDSTHVHSIAHNHLPANTKSGDGEHNHSGQFSPHLDTSAGPGWVARRAVDTVGTTDTVITVTGGGAHVHSVDIPQYTGDSGTNKTSHKHKVNVPKITANTVNAGTANAQHQPPFQVVFFIIKAK